MVRLLSEILLEMFPLPVGRAPSIRSGQWVRSQGGAGAGAGAVPGSLQPYPEPSGAALVPLPVGGWSYLS